MTTRKIERDRYSFSNQGARWTDTEIATVCDDCKVIPGGGFDAALLPILCPLHVEATAMLAALRGIVAELDTCATLAQSQSRNEMVEMFTRQAAPARAILDAIDEVTA